MPSWVLLIQRGPSSSPVIVALGTTSAPPAQCDSSFLNLLMFGSSHLTSAPFTLPTVFRTSPMHYTPFEAPGAVPILLTLHRQCLVAGMACEEPPLKHGHLGLVIRPYGVTVMTSSRRGNGTLEVHSTSGKMTTLTPH